MKEKFAKFLGFFVLVLIISAACVSPRYYSYSQKMEVEKPMIDGERHADGHYGYPSIKINVPQAEGGKLKISGKEIDVSSKFVDRRFYNRSVVFEAEGFEPYKTELKSHVTAEEWGKPYSGWMLLVPFHTAIAISAPIPVLAQEMNPILAVPAGLGVSIIALVPALAIDAYNIVIQAPSVLLVNPWFEYDDLNMSDIALVPTEKLRQGCNKKGSFISNMGCVECGDKRSLIATEDECLKCSSRIYYEGVCRVVEKGR